MYKIINYINGKMKWPKEISFTLKRDSGML